MVAVEALTGAVMQQVAAGQPCGIVPEYVDGFAGNRIGSSVLAGLTDQDLKELGIVLGDRRKLLRAIAELGSDRAAERSSLN